MWAVKGGRPLSCGRTVYSWLNVYGFARPEAGATFAALLPRVNAGLLGQALAAFAAHGDPEGEKVPVLLVNTAGGHAARRLAVPADVVRHFRPPGTPNCSPPSRCGR